MKTNFSGKNIDHSIRSVSRVGLKFLAIAASIAIAAIAFTGCAGDYYAAGYGPAYYAPDYGPYYADYGYAGYPYWGTGTFNSGEIITGGVHHRGSFGGHHFAHEWSGGGARAGGGVSQAPADSGGPHRR
jgi:hypothetical protein